MKYALEHGAYWDTKASKAVLDDFVFEKAKKDTHEEGNRIDDYFQTVLSKVT